MWRTDRMWSSRRVNGYCSRPSSKRTWSPPGRDSRGDTRLRNISEAKLVSKGDECGGRRRKESMTLRFLASVPARIRCLP